MSQKPDLLFIEYAVNDLSHGTDRKCAAMQYETIVREVKTSFPNCDIVTILTESYGTAELEGLYPAAQGHEDISAVYGIPTLWVGKALLHQRHGNVEKEWQKYFIGMKAAKASASSFRRKDESCQSEHILISP